MEREYRLKYHNLELEFLKMVESRYVVNFYGYASDSDIDRYYLLLEYCNSDLQKLIDNRKLVNKSGIFSEGQARKIVDHLF